MTTAYFSHPSLSYHTETEDRAIMLIKRTLGADKVVNPYDFKGKERESLTKMLEASDFVVGMSVYESYPFIVWNDLEYGESLGKETYTINFSEARTRVLVMDRGIVCDYKKLTSDETDKLYHGIMKEDSKGIISSLFLGKLGKKTVF